MGSQSSRRARFFPILIGKGGLTGDGLLCRWRCRKKHGGRANTRGKWTSHKEALQIRDIGFLTDARR
jgi:hypothetical protein